MTSGTGLPMAVRDIMKRLQESMNREESYGRYTHKGYQIPTWSEP